MQGNDRNALQAVHFKGFELEIGVITRYRNRHSLKIFPPPRPEVAFGAPLLTFATRGMGEEGVPPGANLVLGKHSIIEAGRGARQSGVKAAEP